MKRVAKRIDVIRASSMSSRHRKLCQRWFFSFRPAVSAMSNHAFFVAYSSRSRFGKHFIQVSAGVSSAGRSTWPTRNKPSSSTSLIYERKFWLLTRYPLQLQQLIEPKGWVLGRMKSLWSNDSRFTLTDRKRIFDRKYVFCHLRMSKHHVLITMITQQLSLSSLWRARKGIFLVTKVSFQLENEFLKKLFK